MTFMLRIAAAALLLGAFAPQALSQSMTVPGAGGTYAGESIATMTFCSKAEVDALTSDATVQRLYARVAGNYGGVVCPCAEQSHMYYGLQPPIVKFPEVQYGEVTSTVSQWNVINQTNYPFNVEIAQSYLYLQMIKKHPDAVPMGILGCYRGMGSVSAIVPPVTSTTPSLPTTTQSSTSPGGNAVASGSGMNGLAAGLADGGSAARTSIDKYSFCRRPGRSQASIDNCLKAMAP